MSYTNLTKKQWGSSPKIYFTPSYEYYRSGRDMKYKIKITIQTVSGGSYFGYPIYVDLWLDNVQKVDKDTIKNASPSQWTSSIVWESEEFTVSNKTTGTVDLKVKLYSGSGSSRSDTYSSADGDWGYLKISPAASSLGSISNFNIGNTVTVPITKYATYYDILTVKYGNTLLKTYIDSSASGDHNISVNTDDDSFYNALSSNTSGSFIFELSTYTSQGGTLLGKSSKTVTGTIPNNIKPTASLTVAPYNSNEWLNGKNVYVKGLSGVAAILSGSAGRGSAISGSNISVAGETYQGTELYILLNVSGNVSITGMITDKRGRNGTDTEQITVYDYSAPYVQSLLYARGTYQNGIWTADDTGEDIAVSIKVKFSLGDIGNECDVIISIDGIEILTSSISNEVETVLYISDVDGDNEHEIIANAIDSIGNQGARSTNVLSEAVNGWDVLLGGLGVCFGGAATIPGFDSFWPANFRNILTIRGNQLVDFVVEEGTVNDWNYRRWSSGKYECWCIKDLGNIVFSQHNGSVFIGNSSETIDYPTNLLTIEKIQISPMGTGYTYFSPTRDITTSNIPTLSFMRPTEDTKNVVVSICVIGTVS